MLASTVEAFTEPGAAPILMSSEPDLIFFDGDCTFCQRRVRWLLDHDRDRQFRFGPLQGETAARLLAGTGLAQSLSTLVLIRGAGTPHQVCFVKSRAVAAIAASLPFPWRLGGLLALVPRALGDAAYDWVARRRRRFGSADACALPSPADRVRFVD